LKPEKPLPNGDVAPPPLPNNEVPVVDVAVEVAANGEVNPKPVLPNPPVLDVDVGAVEAAAPNPPNVVPVDVADVAPNLLPNGLALEVGVAVLKLPPNGDVVVVLLPNPLPNEPVLGAEVVAVVVAPPPNPLPNGLGTDDVGMPNEPVLGAEVVAVDVAVVPNPLPNGVGVDAVEVEALPKSEPVFVVVAILPNGMLEEVVGAKVNALPPNSGFEPNPVDIIGFVVGEVD
jgi:hypothetical protein